MKQMDIGIIPNDDPLNAKILFHHREAVSLRGQFFIDLVKITSGAIRPTGVHELSGRQLFSPLSPLEVVKRAEEITNETWSALNNNDWIGRVPGIKELRGVPKVKAGF